MDLKYYGKQYPRNFMVVNRMDREWRNYGVDDQCMHDNNFKLEQLSLGQNIKLSPSSLCGIFIEAVSSSYGKFCKVFSMPIPLWRSLPYY
ncbi:hypothetical protein C5167_007867 [Papaver somniferum]|nr:hypothetical protein C5167_007867 [Papaver somniferum]